MNNLQNSNAEANIHHIEKNAHISLTTETIEVRLEDQNEFKE